MDNHFASISEYLFVQGDSFAVGEVIDLFFWVGEDGGVMFGEVGDYVFWRLLGSFLRS